ncbi:MAG: PilZ domain-containing protein [Gammaproteobacteria bacterium]|nr:PilZ domain-containing protein [Pseudomonadales bacterium]MCP5349008.1 PilZ domain-containing protein [Pseudomonadales bacterium]
MSKERRRYFRITDTIDLSFQLLKPQVPDLKLSTDILDDAEMLNMVESELDSVLNSMWKNEPSFARVLGLLNQKINLLSASLRPTQQEIMNQYDHQYSDIQVNLSASGMAFDSEVELKPGDRLEIYLVLETAISGLHVRGDVVHVDTLWDSGKAIYSTRIEFDIESQQQEQLIQHVARRQLKLIRERERVAHS